MANLEDAPRRRRVSYTQLEALCEFLSSHRDIALGYNKSSQARDYSRRMWQTVAQTLNSMGEGAVKSWKEWSSYWVDYKAKLKKKVSNIRIARTQTGGGPSSASSLTEVESRFLQIMGEDYGAGIPGVRIDPFGNEPEPAQPAEQRAGYESVVLNDSQLERPTPGTSSTSDTPVLIVVAPDEQSIQDSISFLHPGRDDGNADAGGGGSMEVEARGDGSAAATGAGGLAVEEGRAGGSAVERRAGSSSAAQARVDGSRTVYTRAREAVRRRRRRVVTAEATRQILIDRSERREQIERTNSELLGRLVNVLERMHETLQQIIK